MTTWQLIREIMAAQKDPDRLGDVVVYKSELTGSRARPEIEARLDAVRGYHPRLDLDDLAAQPDGTFGREYVRFLRANQLDAIRMTGNPPEQMVARNAFTVRYGIIHDMVHVLLGFDASWPGEIGVWSFIGAQDYSPQYNRASWLALLVAPLRAPLRLGACWAAWKKGREMGRAAKLLITERLEDHLDRPLAEVREDLDIRGATDGYIRAAS